MEIVFVATPVIIKGVTFVLVHQTTDVIGDPHLQPQFPAEVL